MRAAAGVLNVVPGEGTVVGARLASHPDVRKIAFTGSTAVGREIMRMAAGNIKRLTLELGGKGPNIVLDDADLDLAADGTLFGCLMNQGQACESGTRIIVAAAVHDKFVERLIERTKTISIGDPLDPATDFGPVISAEAQTTGSCATSRPARPKAPRWPTAGAGQPARGSSAVSGSSRRSSPTSATT